MTEPAAQPTTSSGEHLLVPAIGRRLSPQQRERMREGTTMALYVSLSLLAVLLALPQSTVDESGRAALTVIVLITSIGLIIAHQIAFRISSLLVDQKRSKNHVPDIIRAQLGGGAVATVLALVPLILFGPHSLWLSTLLLTAFVCWVAYVAARSVAKTRLAALRYTGLILLAIIAITAIKVFFLH